MFPPPELLRRHPDCKYPQCTGTCILDGALAIAPIDEILDTLETLPGCPYRQLVYDTHIGSIRTADNLPEPPEIPGQN